MTLIEVIHTAIDETWRKMGTCNVLIAGRTGVGKSTLINAVFRGKMATTGDGKPVTKNARFISKEGVPLGIWDTRGLEMAEYRNTLDEVIQLAERRARDPDPNRHIHVAWLCVHEDSRRVQEAEQHLCRKLAAHMPVLGVVTKARSDEGFRNEAQRLLPEARNVVRVRARPEKLDDGHTLGIMGLDDLIEATVSLLPDNVRDAFAAALEAFLRHKKRQADLIVTSAARSAAAVAVTPIPFSDAAVLVPIQVAMLARISALYGLGYSTPFLTGLVASAAGPAAITLGGRYIVASLLKLVPGGGTAVGGAISAATAWALTYALGEAYIAALSSAFAKSVGIPRPKAVQAEFRRRIRKRRRKWKWREVGSKVRSRGRKLLPFGKSNDSPSTAAATDDDGDSHSK